MKNILKILFVIFLLFLSIFVLCRRVDAQTTYYVKNGGSDAANGLSDATAWETIAKVNSFQSSLSPGDSILFKRGSTFAGTTINTAKSGTSGNPIVYGAYGTGEKPIITGLQTVTGWTSQGDTVYWIDVSVQSNPNYIIINGKWYAMGRAPNEGSFLFYNSYISNTSITDNDLSDSPSWIGSELVIRINDWRTERKFNISGHAAGKLTYAGGGGTPTANYGYFFQSDIKTLDAFGEWYYNGSRLYVYFGAENPAAYTVQVPVISRLFYNYRNDYITVENIKFIGSSSSNITMSSYADYITVQNCDLKFSGYRGIESIIANGIVIKDNTISNTLHAGIFVEECPGVIVQDNTIINNLIFVGAVATNNSSAGIRAGNNTGGIIQYNRIDSTGYNGIHFSGTNTLIKNNFITNTVLNHQDGGGIYTSKNTYQGQQIIGNIVLNTMSSMAGTSQTNRYWGYGIYMDTDPAPMVVSGNTVSNSKTGGGFGMFIGSGNSIRVTGNTSFNNRSGAFRIQDYSTIAGGGYGPPTNHIFKHNYWVARSVGELTLNMHMQNNAISGSFAVSDSNYFARPVSEGNTIKSFTTEYTLATWQSTYSFDTNSKISPVSSMSSDNDTMIVLYINPTKVDSTVTIPRRMKDFDGNEFTGDTILAPYTSAILIYNENPGSPPFLPGVTTNSLVRLTLKTVQLSATLDSTGGGTVTARGFVYSTTNQTPDIDDSKVTVIGTGLGSFTAKITGLLPETTYYFRAYATNETAPNYGQTFYITTPRYNIFKNNAGKELFWNGKLVTEGGIAHTITLDSELITIDNVTITIDIE